LWIDKRNVPQAPAFNGASGRSSRNARHRL
jgi:hypothetical protein